MSGVGIFRAVMVGAAMAMVADGWRSYVASVLLILAFIATDYIAERQSQDQLKDVADRIRTRFGGVR